MIASKNDKLELQDCLEFNRTAKVRCAHKQSAENALGDIQAGLDLGTQFVPAPLPSHVTPWCWASFPHNCSVLPVKYRVGVVLNKQ